MKKLMKIEQMLFHDGVIEEYNFHNDQLSMLYKDSRDVKFLLYFRGDVEVNERGGVGFSIYRSQLDKEDSRTKLQLQDDNLEEMLTIYFRECQIRSVE